MGFNNKGKKYDKTFHNAGFGVIDKIAALTEVKLKTKECSSLTARVGGDIILAKPQTYMNNSGEAVASLLAKYKAELSDLVVVYDDIDLPMFSLRCRAEGGPGTHNGMRNIISVIDSTEFIRVRIGIGRPEQRASADYVLGKWSKEEEKQFAAVFNKAAKAIIEYAGNRDKQKLLKAINEKRDDIG